MKEILIALAYTFAFIVLGGGTSILAGMLQYKGFFPAGPDYEKLSLALTFLVPVAVLAAVRIRLEARRLQVRPVPPFFARLHGIGALQKAGMYALLFVGLPVAIQVIGSELETLSRLAIPPGEFYARMMESLKPTGSAIDVLGAFLTIALVGPFCEEMIYRGFIYETLSHRFHLPVVLGIQAFLFAASHMNPWQFFYALPMGMLLGYLRFASGGLAFPWIVHAANNGLAVFGLYFMQDEAGLGFFLGEDIRRIEHVPMELLLLSALGVFLAMAFMHRVRIDERRIPVTAPALASERGESLP